MILLNELTKGDLIIYEDENDKIEIEAFLYDETIWLPLNKIAELFEKDKSVISRHISNIFEEQELTIDSTVANFATVDSCCSSPSEKTFLIWREIVDLFL